uniref:Putative tick 18.3 kDa family protein n=1 Tax=Rhipicephalus pulchellus TaxID=72859 RepID=L7M8I0_RHIPC
MFSCTVLIAVAIEATSMSFGNQLFNNPISYIPIVPSLSPKHVCYYLNFHPPFGVWYVADPEGTPCWPPWFSWTTGICLNGQCAMPKAPSVRPCNGLYISEGYATSCNYTCSDATGHERVEDYKDDTPCIRSSEEVESIKLAGLCRKGVCTEPPEIGNNQRKQAHPQRLIKCKEKENRRKMILWNCHYYCQINNAWYSGYYTSNLTSACHLPRPTREQPLGWCCRGHCIKKPHCGEKRTSPG